VNRLVSQRLDSAACVKQTDLSPTYASSQPLIHAALQCPFHGSV